MSVDVTVHPTKIALAKFLAGELSPHEASTVADHLLGQCASCEAVIAELSLAGPESKEDVLRSLASEFDSVELERYSTSSSVELAEELLSLPAAKRELLLANSERFVSDSVCFELIERAWSSRFSDVHENLAIMEIACSVAEQLVENSPEDPVKRDVYGRCLSYLANAYRSSSDHARASAIFDKAEFELSLGTGDAVELAHLWFLRTSLRLAKGELEDALQDSENSFSTFVSYGETHLAGMALANGASVATELGRLDLASESLLRSMEMIDPSRERTTFVAVRQNLAVVHYERGNYTDALSALNEAKALYRSSEDRVPLLRAKQFEANIALAMGHVALAEKCFLEARNGFVSAGLGAPAAELSLELANLYMDQQRHTEVRSLAEAVIPIFQCCDLHREVLAALLLFRESVIRDTLTVGAAQGILDFLQAHQIDQAAQLTSFIPRL